jgi:hypothetical protein
LHRDAHDANEQEPQILQSSWLTQGIVVASMQVVYKMDKYGNGEEIRRDALFSPEPGTTQNLPFCKFTDELFLGM